MNNTLNKIEEIRIQIAENSAQLSEYETYMIAIEVFKLMDKDE